jgi:hypothetical protein
MPNEGRGILSPVRLPVPPLQQAFDSFEFSTSDAMKALQRFLPYSGKKPFLRKEQQRYGPVYRMCAHKKFSLFVTMEEKGEYGRATRVGHGREVFRELLAKLPAGSQIALETSGSDCGLVDEMERAGHRPQLAHALTAKRRMEGRHKTDQRDARGWAMLLRSGTLSRVWIRPAELRDQRELLRMRMCLVRMKTHLKNRIHGVLLRYHVAIEAADLSGDQGRVERISRLGEWPVQSSDAPDRSARLGPDP